MNNPESLSKKRCLPCEGGVPPLTESQVQELLKQLSGWGCRGLTIDKTFRFSSFAKAMKFVNAMAALAEEEGHHPDFTVHYKMVLVTLWTHAIYGLTENDFILAAKIDELDIS